MTHDAAHDPDRMLTVGGRPTVRLERRYPHPVDKVWRAVTRPEHLAAWFPSPVEVDLRPGGSMRFSAFEGEEGAVGEVLVVDPPHRFTFVWGSDRLDFELHPDGAETVFVLLHSFDDRAGAASLATGWGTCMAGLRDVLEDRTPPTPDRGVERHEQLVHEFGLDQPEVTTSGDGWRVRFERQLTCPASLAWALFLGTDASTGAVRATPEIGRPFTAYAAPEVVLGTVTDVDPEHLLAFDTGPGEPGDHVRMELVDGTGHGARLVLTVSGSDPDERAAATEQWGFGAVEHIAAEAARRATALSV